MATKYQTSQTGDNGSITNFLAWSSATAGISFALLSLGFTKLADTYTAQWANAASAGASALPTTAGGLASATAFPTTTTYSSSPLAGTHFLGTYSGATAYVAGDVVVYNPGTGALVYINTSASTGVAPTTTANWSPYYMEIWQSTNVGTVTTVGNASGGNTTYTISPAAPTGTFPVGQSITTASCGNAANNGTFTVVSYNAGTGALVLNNASGVSGSSLSGTATNGLPVVYFKIEYGSYTTTVAQPAITLQWGTAYSANTGVLSGFTTNREVMGTTATNGASAFEMDFFGDGCNVLAMLLWRNGASTQIANGWERSIAGNVSNTPFYSTTYITFITGRTNTSGNWFQQSLFFSGTPIVSNRNSYAAGVNVAAVGTLIVGGQTPVLPVFPLVGWVGNPMTMFVAFSVTDTVEGTTISTSVYGATHSYIMTKVANFATLFLSGSATTGIGMRFE